MDSWLHLVDPSEPNPGRLDSGWHVESGTAIGLMSRPLMVCTVQIHYELRCNRLRWWPRSESSQ